MPSNRKLRLTEEAESDLVDISTYTLTRWGESQMRAYSDSIFEALLQLLDFLEQGTSRSTLQRGLRSCSVGEHVAYYRITDDEIVVRRILHSRRRVTRRLVSG
jgi:toxin ParE1/3/4